MTLSDTKTQKPFCGKKRVTYSYQLLCSQLAGRGARKLVIMKWLQTSYTVGILLITESYS